ncbi:hypothetical protein F5Y18DRAFT_395422 [Xylariaceae sp. FL1019]|nr:hypothetical protein F5Y18DRAFT_395422 [Xylariaceae sp. FL1019]
MPDIPTQSPLFSLPSEIRDLVYRHAMLSGAREQHILSNPMKPRTQYRRVPCYYTSDENVLASLDQSSFRRELSRSKNAWRHGHLDCLARARSSRSSNTSCHSSPIPLFLTCRRVYEEAIFRFYHLIVASIEELVLFLGELPRSALDRIVCLTLTAQVLGITDSSGVHYGWRMMCGRLANLKFLENLKLILFSDPARESLTLSPKAEQMLTWIRIRRFEVVLVNVASDTDETSKSPDAEKAYVLKRWREPLWLEELPRLLSGGQKALMAIISQAA